MDDHLHGRHHLRRRPVPRNTPRRRDTMIHPVPAPISQRFGDNPTRSLPASSWLIQTFGNYQPDGHTGIDYACNPGTPVRAAADGTVLHIGWMSGTYEQNPWWIVPSFAGYCAVIDHGSFIGIYGHCQDGSAKVGKGARVSEGQVFILSGNTGGSTGPHLHFEVLPDGWVLNSRYYGRIDPARLLSNAVSAQGTTITPAQTKEWDEMASKEDFKAAIREVLTEGPVLDRVALAILKRDCHLVDPSGMSGEVVGTTSLAKKINWMAHNDAQILNAIVDVSKKIDVTHPVLADETLQDEVVPAQEPAPEEKVA
ncbi:endolysin [Arthrobacter phage vB_ArS-ArV2]|uniref:Peptidase n=1 Tax=Arthrobacter phage vB_ArS-ArV2 TaxID=1414742 RepID=V5R999_9CAUD|nr:endolysin [Arthrobacter phage vB_ArS-ArV2]AHB31632.1 peptidase [Arthrobacter phage vB_ArS-ArV2]